MTDYIAQHAKQLDIDLKAALERTAPSPEQVELTEQAEGIAEYLDRRHEDAVDIGGVTYRVATSGLSVPQASFKYDLVGLGPDAPVYEVIVRRVSD